MKVLMMDHKDDDGRLVDLAMRAKAAGHKVQYWSDNETSTAYGLVDRIGDWKKAIEDVELTILSANSEPPYPDEIGHYFSAGYPIFGCPPAAAEWELDREKGQKALEKAGIDTIPYVVVSSLAEAAEHLLDTGRPCVIKPWGGETDKAMTHVCKDVDDGLATLARWRKDGKFKGQLMLQDKVDGIEMAVSGMFGPRGWCAALEENFECKKLLTGDLGPNTGEMGSILRHVTESKLFDEVLAPLTDQLHLLRYIGPCDVNCIIVNGKPMPLEFTMRCGWPNFLIRQEVIKGDPIEWMADLVYGRDSFKVSKDIAVGIVMVHGDFPYICDDERWTGYPIEGINDDNRKHVHLQQVCAGHRPHARKGEIIEVKCIETTGTYVLIAGGSGGRVRTAARKALEVAKSIDWPSSPMYRLDIGARLEAELPELQSHGFALGMRY